MRIEIDQLEQVSGGNYEDTSIGETLALWLMSLLGIDED